MTKENIEKKQLISVIMQTKEKQWQNLRLKQLKLISSIKLFYSYEVVKI